MATALSTLDIHLRCRHTWKAASDNTSWCLLGCSIGEMGTILFFQLSGIDWPVFRITSLAIFNGLLTSIILDTFILVRQMAFPLAPKTALSMSLFSMISMEAAMNVSDYMLIGGAILT